MMIKIFRRTRTKYLRYRIERLLRLLSKIKTKEGEGQKRLKVKKKDKQTGDRKDSLRLFYKTLRTKRRTLSFHNFSIYPQHTPPPPHINDLFY